MPDQLDIRPLGAVGDLHVIATQLLQVPHQIESQAERQLLRRLAGQVAELAARPIEEEKRQLWYQHNDLQPTRPVIFCDPENGWSEIVRPEDLECRGSLARYWEMTLRKEIFWGSQMGDDYTLQPVFNIPYLHRGGIEDWGLQQKKIGGEGGGSYVWEAPVQSEADLERLHYPRIEVDHTATQRLAQLADDIFGDLLTVRVVGSWWWTLGMTMYLAFLRGLKQMLYDMVDNPDLVHRMMAFLRDGTLAMLDYLEREELLSLNNDGSYVGSGGLGWTHQLPAADFAGKVRTCDLWGFAESQETIGVSPSMFAEFVFQYQLPILARFGLNCYGCCEPVDGRWHVIQQTPNLRRVSCSAWANWEKLAELLGDRYIMSLKPNPADLAMPHFDEERIRAGLRRALQVTRGCRVEILMKDNHTLAHDPQRVIRWCQIAREEAEAL